MQYQPLCRELQPPFAALLLIAPFFVESLPTVYMWKVKSWSQFVELCTHNLLLLIKIHVNHWMKLSLFYFVHCHLCCDFFTFLYFGISFSSHSLHCFLTLFLDVLDLSSSILKFSFFPFNKLGEEMQYITIYAVHTYNNRKCHRDNAKLKDG